MRIRSIKPEFWRSDDIAKLDISARLTFIGLWSYVDDNGVGSDLLSSVAADLYAADLACNPQETLRRVACNLQELSDGGQIVRYEAGNGKNLLYITNWERHQVISRRSKGHMYPLPSAEILNQPKDKHANYMQPSGDTHAICLPGAGEQGNRGAGEQGNKGSRPRNGSRLPDSWQPNPDVVAQMRSDHPNVNIETEFAKFVDYWKSTPGSKGRKLDWNATFRNWIRTASEKKPPRNSPSTNPGGLSTVDQKVSDWLNIDVPADDDEPYGIEELKALP